MTVFTDKLLPGDPLFFNCMHETGRRDLGVVTAIDSDAARLCIQSLRDLRDYRIPFCSTDVGISCESDIDVVRGTYDDVRHFVAALPQKLDMPMTLSPTRYAIGQARVCT